MDELSFKIVTNLSLCRTVDPTLIFNDLNLMEGKCFFYKITAEFFFLPLVLHTPAEDWQTDKTIGFTEVLTLVYRVHHINRTFCASTTTAETDNILQN